MQDTNQSHKHYLSLHEYTIWCYGCNEFVTSDRGPYLVKSILENQRKYEKHQQNNNNDNGLYVVAVGTGARGIEKAAE